MTFITSPCEIAQNASERLAVVVLVELLDIHSPKRKFFRKTTLIECGEDDMQKGSPIVVR